SLIKLEQERIRQLANIIEPALCPPALLDGNPCFPQRGRCSRQHCSKDERASNHACAMSTHEFASAVPEGVFAGENRIAFQVASNVLRELVDGTVTPLRLLL